MSFVIPELLHEPAADEVSAAIAALFGKYAQEFHVISAQTAALQHDFAQALSSAEHTQILGVAAHSHVL